MGEPVVHLSYRERRELWEAEHPYEYSFIRDAMPENWFRPFHKPDRPGRTKAMMARKQYLDNLE